MVLNLETEVLMLFMFMIYSVKAQDFLAKDLLAINIKYQVTKNNLKDKVNNPEKQNPSMVSLTNNK